MTYIDHIRNFNDGQLAYFLNMLHPNIMNFSLALKFAEDDKNGFNGKHYNGPDKLYGLGNDARGLLAILYRDYEQDMEWIENDINPNSGG